MKGSSSKHHYIPRFLTNGFANSEGLLYIYDKDKDEIKRSPRSSKSIFFEEDRNTIHVKDEIYSSVIEDKIFNELDNISSKVVKQFQNGSIDDNLLSYENQGKFQFFLINLFWRIPYTDFAVDDLIKRANISSAGIDPEILRNDETFKKMERVGLFKHTLSQMHDYKPSSHFYIKLSEFQNELFVLGDNPILFRNLPVKFADLANMDYLFAVSSKRIYCSTTEELRPFVLEKTFDFNALIINQSKKYVCSGNRKLLETMVFYYRELKKVNAFFEINRQLFR